MVKQVIILRKDLNMSVGKAVAQGAHASNQAYLECLAAVDYDDNAVPILTEWRTTGRTKIVLACKSYDELTRVLAKAREANLPNTIITDEGRTEFDEPTVTCGAIGPWDADEIDKITKRLRLY